MDKESLLDWFSLHKRIFPWRETRTPYRVWVSETMLQQTRASVVISYFTRWMERFPTLQVLAEADFPEVLKAWEGLGYYSRVRNLHQGAKQIMTRYGGQIPSTKEELQTIQGIGPYTAAAILAFAFQKNTLAIDANVQRVLARYFAIEEDITKTSGKNQLQQAAIQTTASHFSWEVSEALIELGALQCTMRPSCRECPLAKGCQANIQKLQEKIPYKKKRHSPKKLHRAALIFSYQDQLLVRQNAEGQIMADLHEFPYIELHQSFTRQDVLPYCREQLGVCYEEAEELDSVSHGFTKFQVELFPFLFRCTEKFSFKSGEWIGLEEIKKLTFSSGHRRILNHLLDEVLCASCI